MTNRNYFRYTICSVVLFALLSCRSADRHAASAGVPIRKADIRYAHSFDIEYYDHYKLVSVFNHSGAIMDTLRYLLVPEGNPIPEGYPGAQLIRTPVKTMIGMSSMHIALADFAGVAGRITGLGSMDYVSSPEVRANIKNGKVLAVGLDGNMNHELIISMHPGVLIAMGNPDAGFGRYRTLTDAGIPVLLNNEWLETTPLGRAEWVKVMGALVDREELVDKKFDSIARLYDQLARIGRLTPDKPHVIIGLPFKGSWYTPAGESYMAEFLRDAGAGYKWYDTKGVGSLALSFEAVAPEALTAPYWFNIGYVDSKKEITDKDTRYGSFLSFRNGNLYNNNKRTNDQGSNDYWESGLVNPQAILADMIDILHPGLLPGHHLVYYKQLQ